MPATPGGSRTHLLMHTYSSGSALSDPYQTGTTRMQPKDASSATYSKVRLPNEFETTLGEKAGYFDMLEWVPLSGHEH